MSPAAALRRWGLLEQVLASNCPPIERYSFDFGPVTLTGSPHSSDGVSIALAPRRTVLDKILVDSASRAGAEVREPGLRTRFETSRDDQEIAGDVPPVLRTCRSTA